MRRADKESGRTKALREFLNMERDPENIEAYRYFEPSGTNLTWAGWSFSAGRSPIKSPTGVWKSGVDGQGDYASMQEMIFRRIEEGSGQENRTTKSSFAPKIIMAIERKPRIDAVKSILEMYPQLNIRSGRTGQGRSS